METRQLSERKRVSKVFNLKQGASGTF